MLGLRHLFLLTLLLAVYSVAVHAESRDDEANHDVGADNAAFQKLLAEVDPSSIHSALHRWSNKFRDGIFSKDITAIEAVHSENPRLATKLVHLAKRQRSNSTTTTSRQTSTPSETPAETTSEDGPSSTESPPSSPTPAATSSGEVVTTTNSRGTLIASTVSGGVETVPSSSFRRVSSTFLSTTTLANGEQSTVTGVTVVNAPQTGASTPTGSAGVSPSGTEGSPSLQSGAAVASMNFKNEMLVMMGGAVAVAMALQ